MSEQREFAIAEFEKHITRAADGTFTLHATDGIAGVDLVMFEELKRSLEEANRLIRSLELDPGLVEW
jgi:hypothetical protein